VDATIKSTLDETTIRLANGCTVHLDHRKELVEAWAPGAKLLYASRDPDDLDVRDALLAGLEWQLSRS
jgi:hypothetical protein